MNILLVDDDVLVHDALHSMVQKNAYGFTIVGDAYNGEEAKGMVEALRPDVVITDMKMPAADGLTLLEWLQETGFPGKAIVLSGYDDFQYTRPAFLLGVVDYLLKPAGEADLIHALTRVSAQVEADATGIRYARMGLTMVQEEFLSELTFHGGEDENAMIVRAHQHRLKLPQEPYFVIALKLQNTRACLYRHFDGNPNELYGYIRAAIAQCFSDRLIVFRQFYKHNEFVLLLPQSLDAQASGLLQALYQTLREELELRLFAGVSGIHQDLEQLSTAYLAAVEALQGAALSPEGFLSGAGNAAAQSPLWAEALRKLQYLQNGIPGISGAELGRLVSRALSPEHTENLPCGLLCANLRALMAGIRQLSEASAGGPSFPEKLEEVEKHLAQLNLFRALALLRELLPEMTKLLQQCAEAEGQQIEAIQQYLQQHLRDADLTSTAESFGYNKSYFSTLFHTLTGTTFSLYLQKLRMEKARELLEHTGMRIYEVALQVGYDDARYFSQVFRKAYGMQPSECQQGKH